MVAREVKYAIKELVMTELATMDEESLDDIMSTSLHNAQSAIRSVVYNVVEWFMLDLLYKDFIREMLEQHIEKLFDTYAAPEGLSRRLLASRSFVAHYVTFLGRKRIRKWMRRNKLSPFA